MRHQGDNPAPNRYLGFGKWGADGYIFAVRWQQWRKWTVPAAALLVLGSSFLPWYGLRLVARSDAGEQVEHRYVSAWAASTLWSIAILVSVAAGAVWLDGNSGAPELP